MLKSKSVDDKSDFRGNPRFRGQIPSLKLDRKRSKGRQREKMLDSLKSWLGAGRVTDMMSAAQDRDLWKDMIANAMRPGT